MQFTPWDNPMGTDGFEFVEYAAPTRRRWARLFETMGFARHRPPPAQEGHAVPAGRGQLHHQRRAELLRAALRAAARPERVRDGLSREGRSRRLRACAGTRRLGLRPPHRPDGTEHPGHQGHRRFADLLRRPLARQGRRRAGGHRQHQHLRRRLRADRRRGGGAGRPRPDQHRPPDAQRAPRPHEGMGRLLRAAVQLQGSALLRHRRQAHRPQEQGHDQPLRQDPHPHQREQRRQEPDRRVPGPVPRRRHPAHRPGHPRHLRHGDTA